MYHSTENLFHMVYCKDTISNKQEHCLLIQAAVPDPLNLFWTVLFSENTVTLTLLPAPSSTSLGNKLCFSFLSGYFFLGLSNRQISCYDFFTSWSLFIQQTTTPSHVVFILSQVHTGVMYCISTLKENHSHSWKSCSRKVQEQILTKSWLNWIHIYFIKWNYN